MDQEDYKTGDTEKLLNPSGDLVASKGEIGYGDFAYGEPVMMSPDMALVKQNSQSRTNSIYENNVDEESLSKYAHNAKEVNKNACKISFSNINYTVTVPTNRDERANGMDNTKQLHILKDCTGYALPG